MSKFNVLRMVTAVTSILILAVIWLYPVLAYAADAPAAAQSGVSELLMVVLKLVMTIMGLLVTWATTKAVAYFEKKTHIEVSAHAEASLAEWANKGVAFAYEKAHQKLQESGDKLKGPEKLEIAMQFVNSLIKEYKLPEQAEEKIKNYIESALGLMRKDNNTSVPDSV